VIANSREYQITLEEALRFEEALAHVDEENAELSPRLRQAMRESLESQLEELRAQLAEYENRSGHSEQRECPLTRASKPSRSA
jgi:hypothetical protein